jgi:hypothetical protein
MIRQYGPGAVTMDECTLCGTVSWLNTDRSSSVDSVEIFASRLPEECSVCSQAASSQPEVTLFVVRCQQKMARTLTHDLQTALMHDLQTVTKAIETLRNEIKMVRDRDT